jgi:hypothetical protein
MAPSTPHFFKDSLSTPFQMLSGFNPRTICQPKQHKCLVIQVEPTSGLAGRWCVGGNCNVVLGDMVRQQGRKSVPGQFAAWPAPAELACNPEGVDLPGNKARTANLSIQAAIRFHSLDEAAMLPVDCACRP